MRFEHFDVFKTMKIEYGKTGRILIKYSRCKSRHAPRNTAEYYRSVLERIRARKFVFLRSVHRIISRLNTRDVDLYHGYLFAWVL